jgi:hypothetical protein
MDNLFQDLQSHCLDVTMLYGGAYITGTKAENRTVHISDAFGKSDYEVNN